MNFKLKLKVALLAAFAIVSFNSCEDDDDNGVAKPTVEIKELGEGHHHDTKKAVASGDHGSEKAYAHAGGDLHIDAEVVANGLIEKIVVEYHIEGDESKKVEQSFVDAKGLKNTDFHKHIDLDKNLALGEYHFHITVYDQTGQTGSAEKHFELKAAE